MCLTGIAYPKKEYGKNKKNLKMYYSQFNLILKLKYNQKYSVGWPTIIYFNNMYFLLNYNQIFSYPEEILFYWFGYL